jgi:hypothetical protein
VAAEYFLRVASPFPKGEKKERNLPLEIWENLLSWNESWPIIAGNAVTITAKPFDE